MSDRKEIHSLPVTDLPLESGFFRTKFLNACESEGWTTLGDVPWDNVPQMMRVPYWGRRMVDAALHAYNSMLDVAHIPRSAKLTPEQLVERVHLLTREIYALRDRINDLEEWRRS